LISLRPSAAANALPMTEPYADYPRDEDGLIRPDFCGDCRITALKSLCSALS
jgi:hypothetical protein